MTPQYEKDPMEDDYADGGFKAMNGEAEGGETVPCIHLYSMPDGSFKVEKTEGPAPQEGEDAASLDEAMELVREMASGAPEEGEEIGMDEMQSGYAKRAPKPMDAPNPGGVFGE